MFLTVFPCRNVIEIESDFEDEEVEIGDVRKSNRIQQPNVRINPNLMKIKMQVDYNPIVAPKEESLEENNETGMEEDHNTIVEPKKKPCEENENGMKDEVQSPEMLAQVK